MSTLAVSPRILNMPTYRPDPEFGEVGFTEADRRQLIELGVHFKNMTDTLQEFRLSVERRLTRLEDGSAMKTELSRIESEVMRQLALKADVDQLSQNDVRTLMKDMEELRIEQAQWRGGLATVLKIGALITGAIAAEPILIKLLWH
jgi:hypothetical protein